MKRTSWFTIGIVAAIVGLLTVFMALLYNWQLAASVAEREQLQRRAEADAKMFADDFNREIQGAFFNFQVDPVRPESGDGSEIAERFDYWKKNTAYPGLIRQIIALTGDGSPRRFDEATKSFASMPKGETTLRLRDQLGSERHSGPVIDGGYTLAIPLHPAHDEIKEMIVRRSADEE